MSTLQRATHWIDENKSRVAEQAPEGTDLNTLKRTIITLDEYKDELRKCTPKSIVNTVLQAYHLDLDLNLGEAYPIRYGNECTLKIDYKGLIKIAERSPLIRRVKGVLVREQDEFEYRFDQSGIHFRHDPEPFDGGAVQGVYAIAWTPDGDIYDLVTLSVHEVEKARKQAETDYVWSKWWSEMAKKTAIRRLLKTFDTSHDLREAVKQDQKAEYGELEVKKAQKEKTADELNEHFSGGLRKNQVASEPEYKQEKAIDSDFEAEEPQDEPQPSKTAFDFGANADDSSDSDEDKRDSSIDPAYAANIAISEIQSGLEVSQGEAMKIVGWLAYHKAGRGWKALSDDERVDIAESLRDSKSTAHVLRQRLASALDAFLSDKPGFDGLSDDEPKSAENMTRLALNYHEHLKSDLTQ